MLRLLVALLAGAYMVNAVQMIVAPEYWYSNLPGVSASGPYNEHFIRDIGFVYLLSGAALAYGVRHPRHLALATLGGTAWPALHAGFHVVEWFVHGLPSGLALATECFGVLLPVIVGLWIGSWLLVNRPTYPLMETPDA